MHSQFFRALTLSVIGNSASVMRGVKLGNSAVVVLDVAVVVLDVDVVPVPCTESDNNLTVAEQ